MKPVIVILSIVSLGLGVGLLVWHQKADQQLRAARADNQRLVAQQDESRARITELEKVTDLLQTNLNVRNQDLATASNSLVQASADLTKAQIEVQTAQAEIKTARADLQNKASRIIELEGQRDDLSKRMEELTASISTLETRIADTKQKLATSEGDRNFLLSELKRLELERTDLVAQFNNLSSLRAQIAKLNEEAAIKQRLDWMRRGVYVRSSQKGAERLFVRDTEPEREPNNRLILELERQAPKTAPTNAPPL